MQGNVIADKILLDAQKQAEGILNKAKKDASEFDQKFDAFMAKESETLSKELLEAEENLTQDYKANLRIEKNKLLFKKKQEVLQVLRQDALDKILSFDKKKKTKLVDTLVKYNASPKETLYINYPGLTLENIKAIPIVKKMSLKVVKGSDLGLILSSDSVDKNLLFSSLIDSAIEKREKEISELLFD